jgi:hypothetical protein
MSVEVLRCDVLENKPRDALTPSSGYNTLRHPASTAIVPLSHMRMLLGLSEALPSLVKAKFKAAEASSSLSFAPSELAIIKTSTGVPVGMPTTYSDA